MVVRWEVSGVRVSSGDLRSLWDIAVCTRSVSREIVLLLYKGREFS